jgi:hypothetical protein
VNGHRGGPSLVTYRQKPVVAEEDPVIVVMDGVDFRASEIDQNDKGDGHCVDTPGKDG